MTRTSLVPSILCEMTNERRASMEMRPPAFLMTCASPMSNPMNASGWILASMHVTMATFLAGGAGRSQLKVFRNFALAARISSIVGVVVAVETAFTLAEALGTMLCFLPACLAHTPLCAEHVHGEPALDDLPFRQRLVMDAWRRLTEACRVLTLEAVKAMVSLLLTHYFAL